MAALLCDPWGSAEAWPPQGHLGWARRCQALQLGTVLNGEPSEAAGRTRQELGRAELPTASPQADPTLKGISLAKAKALLRFLFLK